MLLPTGRDYNPYKQLAVMSAADVLNEYICDEARIQYMIGAIRVGRPPIDAIVVDLCTNPATADLFCGNPKADQWKQFAGKLVAMALEPKGYMPIKRPSVLLYNREVFRKGALFKKL